MYSTTTSARTCRFQPYDQKSNVPGRLAPCHATVPVIRCANMSYSTAVVPFPFTFGRAPPFVFTNKRSKGKLRVMAMEEDGRKGIPFLLSLQENIASDIVQLIGWTPLVEMKKIARDRATGVRLVGKMEAYQPLCSVKDRTALGMIEDAEKKGLISPGDTLIEVTSGNLGIGLASVAIQKGYEFIAVMPKNYSPEKQKLIEYLGARVHLIPCGAKDTYEKMEEVVKELLETTPHSHHLDQMANEANTEAHYNWTGPEIWKDTAGKVDIFVAGVGSGGTLAGVGKYLKEKNPSIQIISVKPSELLSATGHKIQGIGVNFKDKREVLKECEHIADGEIRVSSAEAIAIAKMLAKKEGLLVGISAGANVANCMKLASEKKNQGKMIVTMLPSSADRYLSTGLFES